MRLSHDENPHACTAVQASDWGRCHGVTGDAEGRLLYPLEQAPAAWTGLPLMVQLLPGCAQALDLTVSHASLAVALSGRGRRRYAYGHRVRDLYTAPMMFELYEEGLCIDHAHWDGEPGRVLGIQFPQATVQQLMHEEGRRFRLPTRLEQFDQRLTSLAGLLWEAAGRSGPQGLLYAQGLTLSLLGLLMEEHGARQVTRLRPRAQLTSGVLSRVLDYIDAHLASDLSVEQLAALVQMSPAHFSRAFTHTQGRSPHAYVTGRRIDRAMQQLRATPLRPLAEIAASLGFASQSHFTEVFKRHVGVTPGRWRQS